MAPDNKKIRWKEEGFECAEFYTEKVVELTVKIVQVPAAEVRKICGRGNACYNRATNTITIPRIKSDYDYQIFGSLGHEIWHALGGKHKGT